MQVLMYTMNLWETNFETSQNDLTREIFPEKHISIKIQTWMKSVLPHTDYL